MRKRRKAMAVWKVILITIASIIGLIGVTVLALWIRGDFNDNPVYPETGIFFVENEKYNSDLGAIESSTSFSLTLSTSTEDVNRRTVNLSLPNGVRENGYIDNGIIRVPETVQLDTAFTVELSRSPLDSYINGGITTITATSTYSPIDPVTINVNIDVPVQEISAYCYDAEDAGQEALGNIFVGSYFNIGVNYSPERSESVFGRDEEKYVFYDFSTNNIEFDYITKTFHATSVSEGTSDEITVFVFSDSEYQKAFLSEFGGNPDEFTTQEEYSEFNTEALNYMQSHAGSYRTYQISDIVVEEISVNSFVVTSQSFSGRVDKMFNVALNSTLQEFDGNLGVVIRDADENVLNSVYGGGVGIALSSTNENIKLSGGEILEVTINATGRLNQNSYYYEYSYVDGNLTNYTTRVLSADEMAGIDDFSPTLPTVTTDGEEVQIVYYFLLPSRNVGGQVGNYNYSFSSTMSTTADFMVALFLENDGEYELFLAENQTIETLSHITIDFQNNVEGNIYWDETVGDDSSILSIVYDSDSMLSDSVELSELINVPAENVYQTVVYFLMFENGAQRPNDFSAVSLGRELSYVNGEDFNMTTMPEGTIYLYELTSSSLSALSGYDKTLYLVFATVRTDAEGNLINANGELLGQDEKYEIEMLSDIKSLEIDATIPMDKITAGLSLTSGEDADIYLDGENILLPSVLTSDDAFTFSITLDAGITLDAERRSRLLDLYNAEDLRIEFRDSLGEPVSYIVTSSDFQLTDNGLLGNIVVYESFNNIEGVVLTPYLIYDNGKQVQEESLTINYNGEKNNFTLYRQSVNSAKYSFETNEGVVFSPSEDLPINVEFNLTTRTITWPTQEGSIELKDLNDRISVILYDTHGKVIRTNVASYSLTEIPITGDRVITLENNMITQFLSTNGYSITTTLQASYRNAGASSSASLNPIYFTVRSEGVSMVEYDTSLYQVRNDTDATYAEFDLETGGSIQIEKYLADDDFVNLNSLVHVYRRGDGGENALVDVTFTLNQADMVEFDSSDLDYLFLTYDEEVSTGISNGIIKLGAAGATTDNIDTALVKSYQDPIYSFKMISALARQVRLVFDITDESGLVNLKLEIILRKNIEYTPLLETYANDKGYSDYLLSGDNDEVRIFGAEGSDPDDPFDLNHYLPVSYTRYGGDEPGADVSWKGNLYISSQTGVVVGAKSEVQAFGGTNITFKDVTARETGSVTFYYKGYNPYGLSIPVNFVLSPNYAYVQLEDYVDLYSLTGTSKNLSEYYALYRATDLIDYIQNGGDVSTLVNSSLSYQIPENSYITTDGATISRVIIDNIGRSFSANLGVTEENNIGLVHVDNSITKDAYALIFVKGENGCYLYDADNRYLNSLMFRVGYGKEGERGVVDLIDEIFVIKDGAVKNYNVLPTSDGFELTLLEGGRYNLNEWTYSYIGSGLGNSSNSQIFVQNLTTNFNVYGTLTLIKSENNNFVDNIIVPLRLTKIGLEYVVYDNEEYDYDIITGSLTDLVENNIYQEFYAGDTHQILYFDTYDSENALSAGYHLLGSENITYNLALETITEGYEDLVSVTTIGTGDINNAVQIDSMIEVSQEVYAVLKLTLTMSPNAQQISTEIFYRIKINPNYSYETDVTYPYNTAGEYVSSFTSTEEGDMFEINFNEIFTSQNASNNVAGLTRFPSVYDDINESVVTDLDYSYYIYSVIVNDSELADYSNYITFDTNLLAEGILQGTLTDLGRSAIIKIRVAREIVDVADSEKVYVIILNNVPSYIPTVSNTLNGDLDELTRGEDGNFEDDVTINTEYSYTITLLQDEGEIQTPVTSNVNAHITSVDGEKYLKPFFREISDNAPLTIYDTTTGEGQTEVSAPFTDFSVEDLGKDATIGEGQTAVTFAKDEFKRVTTADSSYYIRSEDIRYFTFTQTGSQYILNFTTVDQVSEDAVFRIGVYTTYTNAFDIIFNLDGGYDIKYRDKLVGSFASGNDYNISTFIESITNKASDELVALNEITYVVSSITTASGAVYTDSTENFVASDFISIDENVTGIDGRVFHVAGFNEDFSALITATIDEYSFTFTINFDRSFDNSTLRQTHSGTIYSQDSTILYIKSDVEGEYDLESALSVFEPRQYINFDARSIGTSELDEYTFSNGNTDYDFTADNVAERQTFVLDLTMEYRFNGKVMFTFSLEYSYTVLPNVDLVINYPNPQNTPENLAFTREYVGNNLTIDNYFNTAPMFAGSMAEIGEEDSRVYIKKFVAGDYTYDISVYVEEIDNAILTVNSSTQISTTGLIGSVSNQTGEMPNYSFTFDLINLSQVGTITFSIVVNGVTDYYYVTINNNSVITVETNPTNLVENSYERLYVEDIAGATDSLIYSQNRMLKYAFSSGVSGTYYLRLEDEVGQGYIYDISATDTGIIIVEDLGNEKDIENAVIPYADCTLQGVYTSVTDAENRQNALTDLSTIFSTAPYLTSRIVLRYNGVIVSPSVANVYLGTSSSDAAPMAMETVGITKTADEIDTKNIFYKYAYADGYINTNSSFSTMVTVKFDVTTRVTNHYQELVAGQEIDLLNSTEFGIINTETGKRYSASEIEANNAYLNLSIYGFADNPITEGSDLENLHNALKNGTASISQGQRYTTGLIPRYNMELNDSDITQNYLTFTSQGTTQRPNNFTISAQGAGNIGNFVAMKLTYITIVDGVQYTKSADLLFKVLPSYRVEFTAESATGGTVIGSDMTIDGVNYSTNTSSNAYNITVSSSRESHYIYSTLEDSIVRVYRTNGSGVVTNNTNLSNRFTYSFAVNGTSGYNTYETSADAQGLSLPDSWVQDDMTYTTMVDEDGGTISFNVNQIQLGARNYYIDAVDNFGFNIRFYFTINAEINPAIVSYNTLDVNEGDIIQIGAQYRVVSMESDTVNADNGEEGALPTFSYNFAYNLTNINSHDKPVITLCDISGGDISSSIEYRYYYVGNDRESYLTKSYSDAKGSSANNTATLYINTSGISEEDAILGVMYNEVNLSPLHSDSEFRTPSYSSEGMNITLSGFEAYTFNGNVVPYITEDNGVAREHFSNVNNVEISSINFEIGGETIKATGTHNSVSSSGDDSTNLITSGNYMMYGDASMQTLECGYTANNDTSNQFKIPTLPGHLYGTSTVVENVTMVINLKDGDGNTAELRLNLNVSRNRTTYLSDEEYLDTQNVSEASFSGSGTVYNDTLEIVLEPGASVSYAITKDSVDTPTSYTTLSNNRNYTHVEYVRISSVGLSNAVIDEDRNSINYRNPINYYIHINSSELPSGVTFRYGQSEISFDDGNRTDAINIGTIEDNNITLRVESASELNSSNYTTRRFYTLINENGKYYHNNHSVSLYTLANSITTTTEIGVDNYYEISGENGNLTTSYYVISASVWADGLTYSSGSNGTDNLYPISDRPYYYSYSIANSQSARGASVDAMGTITTGTNFNIQTNYIEVDVVLHVAGANGLFEDENGIELGTVRLHLNTSDDMSRETRTGIYNIASSLIVLNDEEIISHGDVLGSINEITPADTETETIVVPVGQEIMFSDYLSSSGNNSSYRIVSEDKIDGNRTYTNWDNEDSYTYSAEKQYASIIVESYVIGNVIQYRAINVNAIAYSSINPTAKAFTIKVGDSSNTLGALLGDGSNIYLAENVGEGIFADVGLVNGTGVTNSALYSLTSKMETINVVSVLDGEITYYEITLLFYETSDDYNHDVALSLRTNYNLYQLEPNATAIYTIDENNNLNPITNESLTGNVNKTQGKTYYAVVDGAVHQINVTYYTYTSQSSGNDRLMWYHDSVTREQVVASMLNEEFDESKTYEGYTLYGLSSANVMTEIALNGEIEMGTLNSNRANINFLLASVNEEDVVTYNYYTFTFYHYSRSAPFDVATSYTTGYALSNLNSLLIDHFDLSMIGSASWYTFENGDMVSRSVIELLENSATNGVITREFYVNINNTYYYITINFHCASGTYNEYLTTTTSNVVSESTLQPQFNSILNENGVEVSSSGDIYLIDDNSSMTEVSSVTLPSDETSAGVYRFLYSVNNANYIFNITILKDTAGIDERDLEHIYSISTATLGTGGQINVSLSGVRTQIASDLGILQRNLLLQNNDDVYNNNNTAFNFTLSEPIINYDYFLLKFTAYDSSLDGGEETTVYILVTNTIGISSSRVTIILNGFTGDTLDALALKKNIISELGIDADAENSTLYYVENGKTIGVIENISVTAPFIVRDEFFLVARDSENSIVLQRYIDGTIIGYKSEDVISEDYIIETDYILETLDGVTQLKIEKESLLSNISSIVGAEVTDVTSSALNLEEGYLVSTIAESGDHIFMATAEISESTSINIILTALNVEVAG